jgi:beta-galactosidase GanA
MTATTEPVAADSPRFPFIFGSQYYRAPTPEPSCWEGDLRRCRDLGFNAVKFFVQWRWSHRGEESCYFDDLDRLMDLAAANGLGVTPNTLPDMLALPVATWPWVSTAVLNRPVQRPRRQRPP